MGWRVWCADAADLRISCGPLASCGSSPQVAIDSTGRTVEGRFGTVSAMTLLPTRREQWSTAHELATRCADGGDCIRSISTRFASLPNPFEIGGGRRSWSDRPSKTKCHVEYSRSRIGSQAGHRASLVNISYLTAQYGKNQLRWVRYGDPVGTSHEIAVMRGSKQLGIAQHRCACQFADDNAFKGTGP